MNENQALDIGLGFTGHFSFNKDVMKKKAKEIRKRGCRAVVIVKQRSSQNQKEYSIYSDQKYFDLQTLDEAQRQLQNIPKRRAKLKSAFENAILSLEKDEIELLARINTIKKELGEKHPKQ